MARTSAHTPLLLLTLVFLLCEIVVGQICRSLLIAVDSFHTLYVLIHLALSALKHRDSCLSPSTAPSGLSPDHCRRMRLQPFGVLISALLMASQCVSISLEIITHLMQPEAIQHPLLSIVIGGVSLSFNVVVLGWKWRRGGTGEAAEGINKCLKDEPHSASQSKDGALQDGALMFCNPEASSVLDPDHSSSSRPESPNTSDSKPDPESRRSENTHSSVSEGSLDIVQPTEKRPEEPDHCTGTEHTASQSDPQASSFRFRRAQLGLTAVIQDLLSPLLVLMNGLVLLLSEAHCHRRHSDCHLLVYLDACFSSICVFVLLSTALPRLRRYGLLLLQAAPLQISLDQVRLGLAGVPGVLSVHELHVWQLSDSLMVASLHVVCPARDCEGVMDRVRALLVTFGIGHCTIQPEFMAPDRGAAAVAGRPICSLCCGQECVEKLCCSPQVDEARLHKAESVPEEKSCSSACPDEIRDVIIENTYL